MAHPDESKDSLHIITDDAVLIPAEEINDFLRATLVSSSSSAVPDGGSALEAVGVRYHVIGIFGGQSSGKSTLLNHVFGTDFRTMDSAGGQHQTTKGAFLSKSARGDNLLIVDFEGTDGVERGEDQSFERQLSLFALSITDTLIVNMWAKDVGRYNAANMALLRIVFEVNLQLFSHDVGNKRRPTLLFVLRDYTKKSKLQGDIDVLTQSLDKIWEQVTKPADLAEIKLQDIFVLRFFPLSHYELQEDQFRDDAKLLQRAFVDKHDEDFLFDSDENIRRIPLESLSQYLASCWKAIKESKDIDIPSQRELLARCRCGELVDDALRDFESFSQSKVEEIKHGTLAENLTQLLRKKTEEYIQKLHHGTRLYSQAVVAEFAEKLTDHIEAESKTIIDAQCEIIAEELLRTVEEDIHTVVDEAVQFISNNKQLLQAATASGDGCKGLPPARDFVRGFWLVIRRGVTRVAERLGAPTGSKTAGTFGRFTSVVAEDPQCAERSVSLAQQLVIDQVRKRMKAMASDCVTHMHKAFEHILNHHPDGTIRFFATSKGLRHAFGPARHAGLLLMSCLLYFRLRAEDCLREFTPRSTDSEAAADALHENEDESRFYLVLAKSTEDAAVHPEYPQLGAETAAAGELSDGQTNIELRRILMSPQAVQRHYELFAQQCNFTLQMQERSIESSKQQIPLVMWLLLALFGFNEVYWLLTNPLMLLLAIVLGYVFFRSWVIAQWQRFEETGPAQIVLPMKMAIATVQPYVAKFEAKLGGGSPSNSVPVEATKSTGSKKDD